MYLFPVFASRACARHDITVSQSVSQVSRRKTLGKSKNMVLCVFMYSRGVYPVLFFQQTNQENRLPKCVQNLRFHSACFEIRKRLC